MVGNGNISKGVNFLWKHKCGGINNKMKKNECRMKTVLLLLLIMLTRTVSAKAPGDTVFVSEDLQLIRITERVYVHVSWSEAGTRGRFASNGMIYLNGKKAFLFDTPVTDEMTDMLIQVIRDTLNAKVEGFVPNHWHDDCMGGIETVHRLGIKSYANELTRILAKSKGLPVPQMGFQDSLNLDFGGVPVLCRFFGPGHSSDNIAVWLPEEKILFGGCLVKDAQSEGLGNTSDAVTGEWPFTVQRIMNTYPDARHVIPGHGGLGDFGLLEHTLCLLNKHYGK